MKFSKNDMYFLIGLGDSKMGFVARSEVGEMYGVPAKEIDAVILSQIYGDEDE